MLYIEIAENMVYLIYIALAALFGVGWLLAQNRHLVREGAVRPEGTHFVKAYFKNLDSLTAGLPCQRHLRAGGLKIKEFVHGLSLKLLLLLKAVLKLISRFSGYAERKISLIADQVRGRGVIKQRGSASLFLRAITEHKKSLDNRKIPG